METPITITDDAKKQFRSLMKEHDYEAFVFGARGGGCSGFNYLLDGISLDQTSEKDEILEFDGVKIVVDAFSMFAVHDTEINYKTDIMGARFEFNNPTAASSCGCGTSFSV